MKKVPTSNKNTKNSNLKLTKNNSFNNLNIEKNNKLNQKSISKNNIRPNSAYQNKYNHQQNKNNINLISIAPKNLFNKEKNSIKNYLENKKDNFIFNQIDKAKKDDKNNIIKNHFNQNNRYKINNNINNDKNNNPIFNPNKLQPPITQEKPKNIKNENEKKIIMNKNNNCINSIIHCFINIKELIEFFLSKENDIKNYKLSNAFLEILKNKEKNINNFEKIIYEMNPSFKNSENNDPKDLVLFLIENMHKELNPINNVNKYFDDRIDKYKIDIYFKSYEKYFEQNFRSIFSDIFYGRYDNPSKFIYGPKISHNIQYFNILVFPLDEVIKYYPNLCKNEINITNCLEYYQRNIKDQNDEKIIKNKKILYAPKVLIISLNYNKLQKKTKFILNNEINLKRFIYYHNFGCQYELIGIVTNIMNSESKKHFIAFCKSYEDSN